MNEFPVSKTMCALSSTGIVYGNLDGILRSGPPNFLAMDDSGVLSTI